MIKERPPREGETVYENDPTVSLGPDTIKKIAEAVKPHTEPRKNVKADSKGRLTGAQPETRYLRREDPDGTITYVPEVPKEFDQDREVTWDDFKRFFGVAPSDVVQDGIKSVRLTKQVEGYIPGGILVTHFVTGSNGSRLYADGEIEKRDTLIRIKKDPE